MQTPYLSELPERLFCRQIGLVHGGCNPTPAEEQTTSGGKITVPMDYLDRYVQTFVLWRGPTS